MVSKRFFTIAVLIWMIIVLATYGSAEQSGRLVSETYVVRSGDTLDAISYRFMAKSPLGVMYANSERESLS